MTRKDFVEMNKKCKIIILEDEDVIRHGLMGLIPWEQHGFTIVGQARNGKDGLEQIKQLHPHIVITDVMMPIMDGLELIENLYYTFPDIKILVLSSYDDYEYVRKAFRFGATDYLLKPMVNRENMLKVLNSMMSKIPNITITRDANSGMIQEINQLLLSNEYTNNEYLLSVFCKVNFIVFSVNLTYLFGRNHLFTQYQEFLHKQCGFFLSPESCTCFQYEDELITLINYEDVEDETIICYLKQITQKFKEEFGNAFFIVSNPFTDIGVFKDVYFNQVHPHVTNDFF